MYAARGLVPGPALLRAYARRLVFCSSSSVSPEKFRPIAVQEARRRCRVASHKALVTRLLFILTRCSRLVVSDDPVPGKQPLTFPDCWAWTLPVSIPTPFPPHLARAINVHDLDPPVVAECVRGPPGWPMMSASSPFATLPTHLGRLMIA